MSYKKVGVVGAGAMGSGIAHAFAMAGTEVVLVDIKDEFVKGGIGKIASRLDSDIKKGKLAPEEKDKIIGRVKGTIKRADLKDCELIIEAILEDVKVKSELFSDLNKICPASTVFATNTSSLSVTELAILSGRPDRFLGIHFFNPVHAMKLVEIIAALDTDKEVVKAVKDGITAIKKAPVAIQDCPGFLVNRILLMYITEAEMCAQEGVSPEVIDAEAKKAGFPMGPIQLCDMVGVDVSKHSQPVLHDAYGDRFPYPAIIEKLFQAGRMGDKTKKGFYAEGKIDDEYKKIVKDLGEKSKGEFSVNRLILRQVNEAIYCVQEGIATPEDIDKAMVLGTGFPNTAGVGGPLHWADEKGLDWVLAELEKYSKEVDASRFWPHYLLRTYVTAGRLGKKTKKGFFVY